MDKRQRLFFQGWSDLRSDDFPFSTLFHKCIRPHEFSTEQNLLSLLRFDHAFTDDDSRIPVKTHVQILNLEFGESDAAML